MQYIKVTFNISPGANADILIALLSGIGFNGFEETEHALLAYIEQPEFIPQALEDIAQGQNIAYDTEVIAPQNWNALWESNFQPVIIDGFCTLRAHFHTIEATTPYDIIITPKMSFGTGHHATTQLMVMLMKGLGFAGKSVLDFGTGTGVLAILAEKLGAAGVMAVDNDTWSVENAIENIQRNGCKHIAVQQGSLEETGEEKYDIILANINRHILLQYMAALYTRSNPGGTILMSGLLLDDKEIILKAAATAGFQFKQISEKNNWIALVFEKHTVDKSMLIITGYNDYLPPY